MPVDKDEPGKKKGKDTDPNNPPMNPDSGSDNIKRKGNVKVDPDKHPSKK